MAIFLFLTCVPVGASEKLHSHDQENMFVEHTAHEHGHASAQITFINNTLKLALSFPSINIYGFEHNPRNDEEHEIILQSQSILNEAGKIITILPTTICKLKSVKLENGMLDSMDNEHTAHDHHESEAHDEEHSDVTIHYDYICENESLQSIEFGIFDYFSTIEEIEAQFISNENQKLFTITPKTRSFSLK